MTTKRTAATPTESNKYQRSSHLEWIPVKDMRVNPLAQRDLNKARVDKLAANFDPELVEALTVNKRGGHFYIIDGQHRREAMIESGWGDQSIQCWVYSGLTEEQEAEMFLRLNDKLTVSSFAKFRVSVQAGRVRECDIDRIVRAIGLVVSQDKIDGAISAVGTLGRVYDRSGPKVLSRALRIIRDSYGDSGLEALVIDGIGLLCARYNGELEDQVAVVKLSKAHGGVNGLLNKAETLRRTTGNQKAHCVAAAAVDIINSGRGGKKLPSWWRDAA